MLRELAKRAVWAIPTLLFVSLFVFLMLDLAPGDPARSIAGSQAPAEAVQEIRDSLNLDDPLLQRYFQWLSGAAVGDFGDSLVGNQPVATSVLRAVPATLSLVLVALAMAIAVSFLMGMLPIVFRSAVVERAVSILASLLIAVPAMWLALLLVQSFAVDRTWFPSAGYVGISDPVRWLAHLILPAAALAGVAIGELSRQLRGSLSDVLEQDYIVSARARGFSKRRVILKHGLKNAAIPVITVLGVRVGQLVGGTVLIEHIFLIDGIGRLTLSAVLRRDIPVVLGVVVFTTVVVLVVNLLVDLVYLYLNPRLRKT